MNAALLAAPVKFNFQPSSTASVSGYRVDAGQTYGGRNGLTYGWSSTHADAVFDRNGNSKQLLDTHVAVKAGTTWDLAVGNGSYAVSVGVGDSAAPSRNNVWIEGANLFNYVPQAANTFSTRTITVPVNDGKLTMGVGGSPDLQTRITFLGVDPTSPPTSPPAAPPPSPTSGFTNVKVNFQPASAPGVNGFLVDAGNTFANRGGRAYGWTVSHADAVFDRNLNSNQMLDTHVAVKAGGIWELSVPDGNYQVKVGLGDAGAASVNNIWVEGVWLTDYRKLAANQFASNAITARVTDGRLTVGVGGAAHLSTRIDYIEVTKLSAFPRQISWQTAAPNPLRRAESTGVMVKGKLYVMGGYDGTVEPGTTNHWIAVPRCDAYDPATNTWKRLANMPEPFSHTSAVAVGNVIWFIGGYEGNHPGPSSTKVWKYDTVADTWSRGRDLPFPRGGGGAALIGNTIYYTTGMERNRVENRRDTWALDLHNQSAGWVAKAPIPTGRNHTAVVVMDGKMYVIGGQLHQEEETIGLKAFEEYDPVTNTWRARANLPVVRSHLTASAFIYQGRVGFTGGDPDHDHPQREVYAWDPVTDTWSIMGYLPAARGMTVTGVLPDGRIIVSTGNGPGATPTTWIGKPG